MDYVSTEVYRITAPYAWIKLCPRFVTPRAGECELKYLNYLSTNRLNREQFQKLFCLGDHEPKCPQYKLRKTSATLSQIAANAAFSFDLARKDAILKTFHPSQS